MTPAEFTLERYKYVLGQKKDLNEKSFKLATVYQAAVILACGATYKVVCDARSGVVTAQEGLAFEWAIFGIMTLASLFFALLIAGGLLSWLKYRRDEADIEFAVTGTCRPAPGRSDILRWYETYLIIGAVAVPLIHLSILL